MSTDTRKRIHRICGCCTSVLAVVMAVLLVIGCVNIYQSGNRPFSREVIAQAASKIAFPGYLCLLSILCGIVLNIALPLENEKSKATRHDRLLLIRLQSKTGAANAEQQRALGTQRRLRRAYRIVTGILITLLALYPVPYYLDASHFTIANLTQDIIHGVLVALIPAAIALLLIYVCGVLEDASIRREIEILKGISGKAEKPSVKPESGRKLLLIRCVIFVTALVFIILGIDNGGMAAVLGKAIRICTECIGLG